MLEFGSLSRTSSPSSVTGLGSLGAAFRTAQAS